MVPAIGGNRRELGNPNFIPALVERGVARPRRRSRRLSPGSGEPQSDPNGHLEQPWARRVRGAARGALISGTRQQRARESAGRAGWAGTDPPVPSGRFSPQPAPTVPPGRRNRHGRNTALPEQPPVPPRGDAETCAPPPHLGSAGRGRAPLLSPTRRGPAPAASRLPWAPSEVRGWLRRSGGAARRGAQGAARGWAERGGRGGRAGGGTGPQMGPGSSPASLASQKRRGERWPRRPTRGRARRVGSGCGRRPRVPKRPRGPRGDLGGRTERVGGAAVGGSLRPGPAAPRLLPSPNFVCPPWAAGLWGALFPPIINAER